MTRFACETDPRHPGPAAQAARVAACVPAIETARLRLRAPRASDFDTWAGIACGPRGVHMGGPMSRDAAWYDFIQIAASWMLHGHGGWTITWKDADAALGFVLIGLEPGDREPEIGWLLSEAAEGRGIAAEAAAAVRAHADDLGLPTLVSCIDNANRRSAALARRLGGRPDLAATHALDAGAVFTIWRHLPTAEEARAR